MCYLRGLSYGGDDIRVLLEMGWWLVCALVRPRLIVCIVVVMYVLGMMVMGVCKQVLPIIVCLVSSVGCVSLKVCGYEVFLWFVL